MQISPRYDGPVILRLDAAPDDPSEPLVRQRRRLADLLAELDDELWLSPTRCEGWSVQDVVSHVATTNQFWALSITSGLAGTPTQFLASFDPVATPAQMAEAQRTMRPSDVLASYVATTDDLAAAVRDLDDAAWSTLAEAPPGHIPIRSVALHALWDAWIHERDIALPLGLTPAVEPDEVAGALMYAAALGPAFRASTGSTRVGHVEFVATDPDVSFVVETGSTVVVREGVAPDGTPRVRGDAVALVEGLSFRGPLDHGLAENDSWLLGGLDVVFDAVPAT